MSEIQLNYNYIMQIDTDPGGTPTLETVCQGFENIDQSLNDVVYQTSYLCDDGFGRTEVTGGQYIVTLTGKRLAVGEDAAQDYIFGTSTVFGFGENRKTTFTISDGTESIEGEVTIVNPYVTGGDAQNPSDCSVEFHFNGSPTIT